MKRMRAIARCACGKTLPPPAADQLSDEDGFRTSANVATHAWVSCFSATHGKPASFMAALTMGARALQYRDNAEGT